jgi:hypothetical protein
MPGSLGVEAILEAMQVYALHNGIGRELRAPHIAPPVGQRTIWKYRGQILPSAGLMRLEAHISRVERRGGQIVITADASLWRDQLRIYELRDLGLAIIEGYPSRPRIDRPNPGALEVLLIPGRQGEIALKRNRGDERVDGGDDTPLKL